MTVARIARLAGVSAPTVSRVLNGQAGVALETRQRVEAVLREHGYRRPEGSRAGGHHGGGVPRAGEPHGPWRSSGGWSRWPGSNDLAVGLTEMQGRLTPGNGRGSSRCWPAGRPASSRSSPSSPSQQQSQLATGRIPLVVAGPDRRATAPDPVGRRHQLERRPGRHPAPARARAPAHRHGQRADRSGRAPGRGWTATGRRWTRPACRSTPTWYAGQHLYVEGGCATGRAAAPARPADGHLLRQRPAGAGRLRGGPPGRGAHPAGPERGRLRRPGVRPLVGAAADHGAAAAGARWGRPRPSMVIALARGEPLRTDRVELATELMVRESTAHRYAAETTTARLARATTLCTSRQCVVRSKHSHRYFGVPTGRMTRNRP